MDALWWQMPGPWAFVEELLDGFRRGESAVVICPEPLPAGLGAAVLAAVAEDRRPRQRLRYPATGPEPLDWLRDCLGLDGLDDPRALARHAMVADYVLWVEGVDAAHWPAWRCLLQGFAAGAREVPEHRRGVFCVPLVLPEVTLVEDVLLRVRPWVGRVREFDMLLYAARLLGDDALNPRRHALRLMLIAELAVNDPLLARALADCEFHELLDAAGLCGRHAALGAAGEAEVRRRIWLAEVRQIFPLLEAHRQAVVEHWDERLRRSYLANRHRLALVAEREDGHRALGFGEICFLLVQCERIGEGWADQILELKRVRNLLAHQQPVPAGLLGRVLAEPMGA